MMFTLVVSDLSLLVKHTKQQRVKIKIKTNIKAVRSNVWSEQKLKRRSAKGIVIGNVVATTTMLMMAVTQARAS